jgi:protein TonB
VIDNRNRVFHYAVFASLALHALLFLSFPDLLSSARQAVETFSPPILARLIAPEPTAPPAAEKPAAPPPKPKAEKPVVKPAPLPPVEPRPSPIPAPPAAEPVPAPAAAGPAPPAAEPAPPAPAPGPVVSAPPAQPGQPGAAAAAREARTIGEYRLQLIDAAKRIKDRTRYPPLARENNWTGNTGVSVAVPPQGVPGISVRGTSGHRVLDQHALSIFEQAAREVPVPQELRGKAFVVEVRMDFTLTD